MRTVFCAGLLVGLVLSASPALAHKYEAKRTLLLESWEQNELHVMASISVRDPRAKKALLMLVDENHDSVLGDTEREAVKLLLTERALFGIKLEAGGKELLLSNPKSKITIHQMGPIEVLVYGKVLLAKGATEIKVDNDQTGDPVELRTLPGSRPVEETSKGRIESGRLSVRLEHGEYVRFRLGAVPGDAGAQPAGR